MISVLTAIGHRHEADFVRTLGAVPGVEVARRCADLTELRSVAAAGVGDIAVLSPDLPDLDRDAIASLGRDGLRVAALMDGFGETDEARLRQLGVTVFVPTATDPARVLAALNAAQSPSTPVDDPPPGPSAAEAPERRGTLVVVWGPAGSPGRTTLTAALGTALAQAGRSCIVADFDTWAPSMAQTLGLVDDSAGLVAAARRSESGRLDRASLTELLTDVMPHLRALTGLPSGARWSLARAAALENVLEVLPLLAEYVVLDVAAPLEDDEELSYDTAAPRRNAATLSALAAAEVAVMVGSGDPVGLQRFIRSVDAASQLAPGTRHLVINKVRSETAGPSPQRAIREVLARFAGIEEATFLPWDRAACDRALLRGATVVEDNPSGPLAAAIADFTRTHLLVGPPAGPAPSARRGGRRARRASRHARA